MAVTWGVLVGGVATLAAVRATVSCAALFCGCPQRMLYIGMGSTCLILLLQVCCSTVELFVEVAFVCRRMQ